MIPSSGENVTPGISAPPARQPVPPAVRLARIFVLAVSLLSGLALALVTGMISPVLRGGASAALPEGLIAAKPPRSADEAVASLRKGIADQQKKLDALTPQEPYLIISTADNTMLLMQGNIILRKGTCSTGSYILLKTHDKREWTFKTPRGMYRVLSRKESPVWYQPDWAFIEEGRKVPAADSPERYEAGVLGDYALSLGHGYMIHGTLYQRYLGLPVTHGCVRLGDEDLKAVYENLHVGSKVFIH